MTTQESTGDGCLGAILAAALGFSLAVVAFNPHSVELPALRVVILSPTPAATATAMAILP